MPKKYVIERKGNEGFYRYWNAATVTQFGGMLFNFADITGVAEHYMDGEDNE